MKPRPINLALHTMSFPVMAISSILHRITGVVLAVLLPYFICLLHSSLKDEQSFNQVKSLLAGGFHKFIIWGFLSALMFHLIAGIRHLIMDMGYGESVCAGKLSAQLVIVLSAIVALLIGGWLW